MPGIRVHTVIFTMLLMSLFSTLLSTINVTTTELDNNTYQLSIVFTLEPGDFVYKDYIDLSIDHPDVTFTPWQASIEPTSFYDPLFKETKKIFNKSFTITTHAHMPNPITNAYLHLNYYQHNKKNFSHDVIPLSFGQPNAASPEQEPIKNHKQPITTSTSHAAQSPHTSWSTYISTILATTESYWVRLILALLLGVLLSLTPCIYPMIPITVGILQTNCAPSFIRSFLRACAYTTGIATTFALLGLIAASTGQLFGSLLASPLFVIPIVALLAYLAGSMLGLYELRIPRFLQTNMSTTSKGSLLSAFAFGAASGTVASPCLSPGLLLLLTLVTTMNNKLLGFSLLFMFGIGISLPLLLIGTFSSSLNRLPKAGMWMVEIKKIFGFILLGTCFYFLGTILPLHVLLLGLTLFIISTGIYYIYDAKKPHTHWQKAKNILGMMLIASSVVLAAKSYQAYYVHTTQPLSHWFNNYDYACQRAQQEHKKMLLIASAPFCSLCTAIHSKIFSAQNVIQTFEHVIPIKIENIGATDTSITTLRKQFNIIGVPTVILIDPDTHKEIKRWGGELYDYTPATFIQELEAYI